MTIEHIDLMRDEFKRIAACPGATEEIIALCRRAEERATQSEPVIVQRDRLERENTGMRTLLRDILADLEQGSTDPTWPDRIRATLDDAEPMYAFALHSDGTTTDLKKPFCLDCGSNNVHSEGKENG